MDTRILWDVKRTAGAVLGLVTLLLFALPVPAAGGLLYAATGTYTPTTSTSVNKIWRKVQTNLQQGFNFMNEEWEGLEDLQNFDVDWSTREILVPLDLNDGSGVASIPEGGYEAFPSSPNAEELSLTWIMFNKRFTASKTTRYIDERSRRAQIRRQLLFQGKKAIEDISRAFSDYFFGYSTAYLAQTSTVATQSSGAYTLINGYGDSTISNAAFIADKFRVGDRVALIRSGGLVTNAIGIITAINKTTPTITVTWNGSVASQANDYVVKANSLENTTLTATDYNLGLVGLLDGLKSTSVHGLSSGTNDRWAPAYTDATGGRFSGIRLHRGADEISNKGGGMLDCVYIAQGVYRDLIALQQAALRFSDPFALEIDGDVKSKGRTFKKSRRVPPGYVIAGARKSLKRMTLLNKPDANFAWNDGKELQDQSGYVFSVDFPCAEVWLNRANWAYWSGLTEQ